jgi:hypothetical protein
MIFCFCVFEMLHVCKIDALAQNLQYTRLKASVLEVVVVAK